MPDILHRVEIASTPDEVFNSLTTVGGLAGWWTRNTHGDSEPGGIIRFRFGDHGHIDMKVLEIARARHVLWQVMEGPSEWIGTNVSFELTPLDGFTAITFEHRGWKEPTDFMHHCSTKWAVVLMSLKGLLERGQGTPYPHDVRISIKGD